MTWTRLDENFPDHPKIVAAGERAELLHIHGIIYCNRFLLDGRVPRDVAPTLLKHGYQDAIKALVKLGIWMEIEDGYEIHDFLVYQPSRAEVLAKRQQKASAGQAGGLARARQMASKRQAEGQAESKPVPVPVPESLLIVPTGVPVLHKGTVPKGTTNGETTHISESFPAVMSRLKVDS